MEKWNPIMEKPTTHTEYVAARNRSTSCRHILKSLEILEDTHSPTLKSPSRSLQQLWCGTCGAIKYAYCYGHPDTRVSLKNGIARVGFKYGQGKNL